MSTYRIAELLAPKSVALIGGSERETSVGRAVLKNLRDFGFGGRVHFLNSKLATLLGYPAKASVLELDEPLDLAVITTPADSIPELIEELGRTGCKTAIIISAGLGQGQGSRFESARLSARKYGLRVVGPNCIGVLTPAVRLNASFAAHMPKAGDLALISQSGAVVSGVIEWAASRNIGFSSIVSVGDQMDVDSGDLLDHFANDGHTRAILMYLESVRDARKFMSAARIAARAKPVVILKAGRFEQGARAAATHTGAMAGSDAVYDAAFRRAGLLRVFDLEELFEAAEVLSAVRPFRGERLAILTNGGGLGVLAADKLAELGGKLATLSPELVRTLDARLPANWSKANPVDVIGDAGPERYEFALEKLLGDPDNDGVVVMNVATSLASPLEIAGRVASVVKRHRSQSFPAKPVLAVWISEDGSARQIFAEANIPLFSTEKAAVRAFSQLVRYSAAQEALRATPPKFASEFSPDREAVKQVIDSAIEAGQRWLSPEQMRAVLSSYRIPVLASHIASSAKEAGSAAKELLSKSKAVALKVLSPDIVHKSDVGGVRLGIRTAEDAESAAAEMLTRIRKLRPDANITGFIVQEMVELPNARELIVGVANDMVFGRVIVFGQGGVSVEVVGDKAIGLPPLDLNLAESLIDQTRVSKLLNAYRNVPAARKSELAGLLVKVSQLICDFPQIIELDFNPVLVNADRAIVLDSRVLIGEAGRTKNASHLAIRPYPNEWEQPVEFGEGQTALVRPLRPEDELLLPEFFAQVTEGDLRLRFFNVVRDPGHVFFSRLTQLDYARAMAFAALDGSNRLLGVVRLHADANYETGEYAILVRSDLKGKGLGWKLMELIIRYARAEGLKSIHGEVLTENTTMLAMCRQLGFDTSSVEGEPNMKHVRLTL